MPGLRLTRMLPGCGSAWTKPDTKIWWENDSTIILANCEMEGNKSLAWN